ncbi:hypothetical protein KUCAC02_007851 [Chaenocephalus aceratus]|uniref:Uncharacterized protein n=1 Tax=Chaenocephalus aceratus TaxID=36190 RepID=A0ACB9X8R5_CHAAC|nr:hypothetical protein KUCAC02_007851 [Chaenocephalus aceratus]
MVSGQCLFKKEGRADAEAKGDHSLEFIHGYCIQASAAKQWRLIEESVTMSIKHPPAFRQASVGPVKPVSLNIK